MSEGKADELQQEEAKRLETQSIERRRLIGQAIIDGILSPSQVVLSASYNRAPYRQTYHMGGYNQTGGDFWQRHGAEHLQSGGGNYDQGPAE